MGQRWWNRSVLPYLVLALSPVLTLPISGIVLASIPDCGVDEPWWELRHFELALVPALADFVPFLWLASAAPGVRRAATVAGLLGAARYAIPQAVTLVYSISSGGQGANTECTISSPFVAALAPVMLTLWLVTALVVAVILRRTRGAAA